MYTIVHIKHNHIAQRMSCSILMAFKYVFIDIRFVLAMDFQSEKVSEIYAQVTEKDQTSSRLQVYYVRITALV